MKRAFFIFLCVACAPVAAHAEVIINEIAWMGTTVSANDEWIELFNSGSAPVALDGWHLSGQDGAPNIALSGTVDAGGYFLLERTDDETVPGVTADLLYTGALGNETENLTLADASGATVDSVQSGENWSLGGDNTTKHTAQRQADNTWITGVPTPRAQNSNENTKTAAEGAQGEVAGTSTSNTTTKTTNGYKQNVYAYAGQDTEAVAGAYAFLEGQGVDEKNGRLSNARFSWSFGDGGKGEGEWTRHIYRFPGTYTAVLSVSNGRQTARDKTLVRVFTADVAIDDVAHGADGFITLRNNGVKELDVSLWKLRVRYAEGKRKTKTFTFPITTTLAPLSSVPIPSAISRLETDEHDSIALILPSGKVIAEYGAETDMLNEQ